MSDRPHFAPRSADAPAPIVCVYQPVVDLLSRQIVGFEALSRWPDEPHRNPAAVFAAARIEGTLDDLDRAAQRAALLGARNAGLPESYTLFVNVEADTSPGVSLTQTLAGAGRNVWAGHTVIEITERALLANPGRVIDIADSARALGFGVALDDVGANPECLTMLDFVAPDIIKIDGPLIRSRSLTPAQTATLTAINAYTRATPGVRIIAEGIETAADLTHALTLGATHGQGWFFGRPAALPSDLPPLPHPAAAFAARTMGAAPDLPSALLARVPTHIGGADLLTTLAGELHDTARELGAPITVLAAFPRAADFTPAHAQRFTDLAVRQPHSFVAVLAVDMPPNPAPKIRGISITPGDALAGEGTLTVMASDYHCALITGHLDDLAAEPAGRYTYALTRDRAAVTTAARSLMRRIGHHTLPPRQPTPR